MSKLYSNGSRIRLLKETVKSYGIAEPLKRLARLNALRDYRALLDEQNSPLWDLHQTLENIRLESQSAYKDYDYGSGYYYQSYSSVKITGYRDTDGRVDKLQLGQLLQGKRVLDIGCNSGFILLSVADRIRNGTGVEINPYLIRTANAVKGYKKVENIEFVCSAFEDYAGPQEPFDVVLSFANHSTYDGNTKQSIDSYFEKCASLLGSDGQLLFESHAPQIEPSDKLGETLQTMSRYFRVESQFSIDMHGFLDKGRTYVIARKNNP